MHLLVYVPGRWRNPSLSLLVFPVIGAGPQSDIRYPSPRVSYYFPSARQVPPIPIRASATIPLPRVSCPPSPSARQLLSRPRASATIFLPRVRYPPSPSARQLLSPFRASAAPHPHPRVSYYPAFRASGMRQALPLPVRASAFFEAAIRPAARQVPPLLCASVPPLLPSARQLLFSFRGFRASGNPHPHPRVSYYFPSARQVPPTVRYPPSPSARQLLSSLPRVRYASGAPHSRSARQPFSKLLFALPRVRYLPSSARQFRPNSHPLVSYYFPSEDSAHQVTPIFIRASATIFLPRVRYPTPIRASATVLPSARQVCVRRSPLPVRASAFFEAAIRPAARQVPPLLRASVPPLRPSARQLLFSFRASGNPHPHPRVSYYFPRVRYPPPPSARQLLSPFRASGTPHPHPRVSYYPPFRASAMRQALPTPGPRVSLFRSFYSPCRASVPLLLPSARQLLFSFRASGNPHPHPCVSYYTPSARQVPPHPQPRVSYYPPFRASGIRASGAP